MFSGKKSLVISFILGLLFVFHALPLALAWKAFFPISNNAWNIVIRTPRSRVTGVFNSALLCMVYLKYFSGRQQLNDVFLKRGFIKWGLLYAFYLNTDEMSYPGNLLHIVWKLLKVSHLNFWILAFSTNFCPGNTVWPQASDFQKIAKMNYFWHF